MCYACESEETLMMSLCTDCLKKLEKEVTLEDVEHWNIINHILGVYLR